MLYKWVGGIIAASLLLTPCRAAGAVTPIPKTDIVIDIGHGGIDGGTTYRNILEKDINLAVGLKLYPLFRKQRITASITRTTDYALSDDNKWKKGGRHKKDLAQRMEIANRLKPSYLISIHVNWASNRQKSGPLVIYRKDHPESKRLAERLQKELNALYGSSRAPEPSRKYYLLHHAEVGAVIVELGFLSNSRDRSLLTAPDFQQKLAEAIFKATAASLKEDINAQEP